MEQGLYENDYEYVKIGEGQDKLLVIPGLNDEMIKSTRYPLFLRYYFRSYTDRRIIVVSRKEGLDSDVTTEDMAEDYREIIKEEGNCDVLGISLGGFIAQHLAMKTDKVDKLVLGFTGTQLSNKGQKKIDHWINLLEKQHYGRFYSKAVKDTFSGLKQPVYRVLASGLWRKFPKPPAEDLIAASKACIEHDTSHHASDIENETMVIGADRDEFFPQSIIERTASNIGAECRFISGKHAAFHQNSSHFHDYVRRFLNR